MQVRGLCQLATQVVVPGIGSIKQQVEAVVAGQVGRQRPPITAKSGGVAYDALGIETYSYRIVLFVTHHPTPVVFFWHKSTKEL